MEFPILFKRTATGAIQYWKISTQEIDGRGIIDTEYGQVGTDSPQFSSDTIKEGKNAGKKNATTAIQQAEAEAKSLWTQKKKKGYVEDAAGAEVGERDEVIKGGIDPMLAHHYMDVVYDDLTNKVSVELSKDAKKIKWPAFAQPKLDGIRCLAVLKGGKATLWTRTRKPITSCPHVVAEVERMFGHLGDATVDGELYNHALKADFELIVSAVRKEEPTPECAELVQYHVYDLADDAKTFKERSDLLLGCIDSSSTIKRVETLKISNHDEAFALFERFCKEGYEGIMVRNAASKYESKRSYSLQKGKPFHDDEFEIVGFTEGRGKLAGKLGTFICKTKAGAEFETPMNGEQEYLERLFKEGDANKGKLLTIRFQGYTGKNKVPRFPKGRSIRNYE